MTELPAELIRRVLVTTQFDYCDELFWRHDDGELRMFADCSDLFDWGIADVEPIETREDVELLEKCLADLQTAQGTTYPHDLTNLYAARRRKKPIARWFLARANKDYVGDETAALFKEAADE